MRRHLLGIFAICLIVGWIVLIAGGNDSEWAGFCMKGGFTLAALWLAFPQALDLAERVPPWLIAAIVIGGSIVIWRPRLLIYVAPALLALGALQFVGWLFKPLPNAPKRKTKPRS